MPLLPYPRRLSSGEIWYGQEKFGGQWRRFSTHCRDRKTAERVCTAVRSYCGTWASARLLLAAVATCVNDAAVTALLANVADEFKAGRNPLGERPAVSFMDVATSYIRDRRDSWAPSTVVSRQATYKRFAAQSAAMPDRESVGDFRDRLLTELRPNSVNIHLRNLRSLCLWYADQEPAYKAPKIRQVKAPGAEHRDSLTRPELMAVLEQSGSRAKYFAFLALTGMRRGEALGCRWEWVRGQFIEVPAPATKTNRKRLVPVTDTLRTLLESLPQPHTGPLWGDQFRDPSKLSKTFRRACRAAGISRPLKLHNLRDTYIVAALTAGVPAALVASICGNSIAVIERHYAALAEPELQRAVDLLNSTNMEPTAPHETNTNR